jgi:hypothetical protein
MESTNQTYPCACDDPKYRAQIEGLKQITALLNQQYLYEKVVNASEFHPMRGHVADGTRVRFQSGEELTVRSAMRGWKLVDQQRAISMGPFDGAHELTRAIVQLESATAGATA